jgi:hypothetical protein
MSEDINQLIANSSSSGNDLQRLLQAAKPAESPVDLGVIEDPSLAYASREKALGFPARDDIHAA